MHRTRKHRILIVDDENANISVLTHILLPEYTIYAAKCGKDAIMLAKKYVPHVILLDIVLPDMDGYEVLSALKRSEETAHIPVIFISGLGSADDEKKGLSYGAADYITKPFSQVLVKLRVQNQIKLIEQFRAYEYDVMKYKIANDALNIAMWDMDVVVEDPESTENRFTWSQEFREMLGFSDTNDFPDALAALSERLHPDDAERVPAAFNAHFLDRSGQTPYDIEYRIKTKGGEYRHFHALGTTRRDPSGIPMRVAGTLMDITEKKQLESEAKRRVELEAVSKAKSIFLARMSHEIRTPMNAIMGINEILLQKEGLPADVVDDLQMTHTACGMLLGIINDLLDFSKIEAGQMDINTAPYSVASLINDAIHLNMVRIVDKPIEFIVQIDERLPAQLIGDELRIKQIFNNLLSNAFKYTDSGTVTLEVFTEAENHPLADVDEGTFLVLVVKDTGRGMSKEQVGRLFNEYTRFRENTSHEIEGTGLGLNIAKHLLSLMDGQISVESKLGVGSTFCARVPQGIMGSKVLGPEVVNNLRQFNNTLNPNDKKAHFIYEPLPYGSVLLVDDVESNLYVAKGLMKPYQLRLETAMSGKAAIEKVKAGKQYDIIFMDHMMPEMDGMEAARIIRALGYTLPIVALTANAMVGQAELFLANGFDDFISKPIDLRQLNAVLLTHIRDKQNDDVVKEARSKKNQAGTLTQAQLSAALIADYVIEGMDVAKGLHKFSDDSDVYLKILRKYAANLGMLLGPLAAVKEGDLRSYEISVHGIKGTSLDIFAEALGEQARSLEAAAKAGDFGYIEEHNPAFITAAAALVENIELMLKTMEEKNPKPKKDKPDEEMLKTLVAACEAFSMNGVDAAMAAIESYAYDADEGLLDWLRERVEMLEFDAIIERLEGN